MVYDFNKHDTETKYLRYNGKDYKIKCGYKTLKRVMKAFKTMGNSEDEMQETENILKELLGDKVVENIVNDDDFTYMDFSNLFKTIMGAVQGVEPDDMEEYFRQFEEQN